MVWGGVLGLEDGVGWRGRGALGVLESFPASRGVNHSQSTSPDQQFTKSTTFNVNWYMSIWEGISILELPSSLCIQKVTFSYNYNPRWEQFRVNFQSNVSSQVSTPHIGSNILVLVCISADFLKLFLEQCPVNLSPQLSICTSERAKVTNGGSDSVLQPRRARALTKVTKV